MPLENRKVPLPDSLGPSGHSKNQRHSKMSICLRLYRSECPYVFILLNEGGKRNAQASQELHAQKAIGKMIAGSENIWKAEIRPRKRVAKAVWCSLLHGLSYTTRKALKWQFCLGRLEELLPWTFWLLHRFISLIQASATPSLFSTGLQIPLNCFSTNIIVRPRHLMALPTNHGRYGISLSLYSQPFTRSSPLSQCYVHSPIRV